MAAADGAGAGAGFHPAGASDPTCFKADFFSADLVPAANPLLS